MWLLRPTKMDRTKRVARHRERILFSGDEIPTGQSRQWQQRMGELLLSVLRVTESG